MHDDAGVACCGMKFHPDVARSLFPLRWRPEHPADYEMAQLLHVNTSDSGMVLTLMAQRPVSIGR